MQDLIFWSTLLSFDWVIRWPQLCAALLATYGVMKLIEFEKYGPLNVLKVVEWVSYKLMGKYCDVCSSFWVALVVLYLLPDTIAFGLAGTGAFIAIEIIGTRE